MEFQYQIQNVKNGKILWKKGTDKLYFFNFQSFEKNLAVSAGITEKYVEQPSKKR